MSSENTPYQNVENPKALSTKSLALRKRDCSVFSSLKHSPSTARKFTPRRQYSFVLLKKKKEKSVTLEAVNSYSALNVTLYVCYSVIQI